MIALDLDLTEPLVHARADMAEFWRIQRRHRPIFWQPGTAAASGFWVVCGYHAAAGIYRDHVRFTSQRGNVLLTLLAGGDSAAGDMLAVTDPPRHTVLRRLLTPALSRKALCALANPIRDRTRRLLSDRVGTGPFDFAREVASRILIYTICDLLGIAERDHELLVTLTKQALGSEDAAQPRIDAMAARQEILLCLLELVQEQRRQPAGGLVSALIAETFEGAPLTDDQIVTNCYSMILGGDETSRLILTNTAQAFVADPSLWDAFGEVTDLPTAVEEILRCFAPTMHFGRVARTDVELPGADIAAGDIVTLWNISANRDESRFPSPDTVRFDRKPNPHLSFGFGPHHCVGAHLARLEIGIVLDELRGVTRVIRPAGTPRPLYSNFLHGYATLPIELA
ncbi:cytochrome P450 [Nocardia iowensis]|uniref:Cytochrome P450 n=1 Tax=Nocardia iowensis TaxID=204891 RepID=A0ABX8RZN7_NOCIO|nr:cytochrome P450 [Nocardia iowensis]QXN94641.1 cytochrome P450 [Nocardia iowensis]